MDNDNGYSNLRYQWIYTLTIYILVSLCLICKSQENENSDYTYYYNLDQYEFDLNDVIEHKHNSNYILIENNNISIKASHSLSYIINNNIILDFNDNLEFDEISYKYKFTNLDLEKRRMMESNSKYTTEDRQAMRENGMWKKILQLRDSRNGFFSSDLKRTGIENENNPRANTWSIIGKLQSSDYRSPKDSLYYLKLEYFNKDNTKTSIMWAQSNWITSRSPGKFTSIEAPNQNSNGCTKFKGLGKSGNRQTYLDGNGKGGCWWNAVGPNTIYRGGLPGFDGKIAYGEQLFVFKYPGSTAHENHQDFTDKSNHKDLGNFVGEEKKRQFDDAKNLCRFHYGDMVSINNERDNADVLKLCQELGGDCWIGIQAPDNPKGWNDVTEWVDGEKYDKDALQSYWSPGEPNNSGGNEKCAEMWNSGKWNDISCVKEKHAICRKVENTEYGNYVVVGKLVNWADADEWCKTNYGQKAGLARIRSEDDNHDVINSCKNLRPGSQEIECWIGLKQDPDHKFEKWDDADQSIVQFKNWITGNPKDLSGGDCAAVKISRAGEEGWINKLCSDKAYFVCDKGPSDQPQHGRQLQQAGSENMVMENDALNINCEQGKGIKIHSAIYGRNCPNNGEKSVTDKLAAECNGKPQCAFTPNNANLGGDPCIGIHKQFHYQHSCEEGHLTAPRWIGCYKDTGDRALRFGPHNYNYNAETCATACKDYKFFALQDGSWCSCDNDKEHVTKYGTATNCPENHNGGPLANDVYEQSVTGEMGANSMKYIGCYADTGNRALRFGPHNWHYNQESCSNACKEYKYFALQAGSWCSCDNDFAHATKYGPKNGCPANHVGTGWGNDLYQHKTATEQHQENTEQQRIEDEKRRAEMEQQHKNNMDEISNQLKEAQEERDKQHQQQMNEYNKQHQENMNEMTDRMNNMHNQHLESFTNKMNDIHSKNMESFNNAMNKHRTEFGNSIGRVKDQLLSEMKQSFDKNNEQTVLLNKINDIKHQQSELEFQHKMLQQRKQQRDELHQKTNEIQQRQMNWEKQQEQEKNERIKQREKLMKQRHEMRLDEHYQLMNGLKGFLTAFQNLWKDKLDEEKKMKQSMQPALPFHPGMTPNGHLGHPGQVGSPPRYGPNGQPIGYETRQTQFALHNRPPPLLPPIPPIPPGMTKGMKGGKFLEQQGGFGYPLPPGYQQPEYQQPGMPSMPKPPQIGATPQMPQGYPQMSQTVMQSKSGMQGMPGIAGMQQMAPPGSYPHMAQMPQMPQMDQQRPKDPPKSEMPTVDPPDAMQSHYEGMPPKSAHDQFINELKMLQPRRILVDDDYVSFVQTSKCIFDNNSEICINHDYQRNIVSFDIIHFEKRTESENLKSSIDDNEIIQDLFIANDLIFFDPIQTNYEYNVWKHKLMDIEGDDLIIDENKFDNYLHHFIIYQYQLVLDDINSDKCIENYNNNNNNNNNSSIPFNVCLSRGDSDDDILLYFDHIDVFKNGGSNKLTAHMKYLQLLELNWANDDEWTEVFKIKGKLFKRCRNIATLKLCVYNSNDDMNSFVIELKLQFINQLLQN